MNSQERFREGKRITWWGIGVNLFLTLFKVAAGILGRSHAMLADGVHSLSDILAGGIVLVSLRISQKPRDRTHPYGHGKAESIAAFVISIVLLVMVLWLSYEAFTAIADGTESVPGVLPIWAAVTSLVMKEAIFRYSISVGNRLNSPAITANAWEHRSDAVTSLAALLGILGARHGYPFLDPLAGFIVAVFILKTAIKVYRSAARELMDHALPLAYEQKVRAVVSQMGDVKGITEVKTRSMGSSNAVDLTIVVDPHLVIEEADRIARKVRDTLSRELEYPGSVMVYPVSAAPDRDDQKRRLDRIADILRSYSGQFVEFHDLRIIPMGGDRTVYFHLVMPKGADIDETCKLCARFEDDIRKEFPELEVSIRLDQPK